MRLSVFSTNKSNPQLLLDLDKIYQPYFANEQLTQESLQRLIEDPQTQYYLTMFNERHLGAVQVKINGQQAQLSLLTIRDLTRRKGIAKNLLREVEKQLKKEGTKEVNMDLSTIQSKEQNGLTLFMKACDYQLNDQIFSKTL